MSTPPATDDPRPSSSGTSLAIIVVSVVLVTAFCGVCGLGLMLFPALNAVREAARRNACAMNEMNIATAIQQYESEHGHLPPPFEVDEQGRPMHSWRVLILPYLGQQALFDQYDFDESWDSPNNRKLADQMPAVYRCPSAPPGLNTPNYLAVVGAETAWPTSGKRSTADIDKADGMATTILLVEVENTGFNWLEPRDLTLDEAARGIGAPGNQPGMSSAHSGGANVVFCDGHESFVSEDIDLQVLRDLLTATGRGAGDEP